MPRTKNKTKTRHPWTRTHDAQARRMLKSGMRAAEIAKRLNPKRSENAFRQHCAVMGISLRAYAR